jgi:hypothetical protein
VSCADWFRLRNRNVCLIVIQTWLVGIVYYGGSKLQSARLAAYVVYFTPLYLQNVRGFGIIESAALLLPLVLSQVITTSISGYAIKWTGYARSSFLVGFLVWLAGQGAQISFGQETTTGVIVGCLLLQGLGIGSTIQSSEPYSVRSHCPLELITQHWFWLKPLGYLQTEPPSLESESECPQLR